MKKIDGEQISALLDGEVEPDVRQTTVSQLLDTGPEALDTYARYRLIGDLMRDEAARPTPVVERVSAALRDEPTVLAPPVARPKRWLRPVAGVAVAASVATAAIMIAPQILTGDRPDVQPLTAGVQLQRVGGAQPQLVATRPQAPAMADRGSDTATGNVRWQALDGALEERLNRLLIEHNEYAGRTGVHGPVPHIGLVGYDAR